MFTVGAKIVTPRTSDVWLKMIGQILLCKTPIHSAAKKEF